MTTNTFSVWIGRVLLYTLIVFALVGCDVGDLLGNDGGDSGGTQPVTDPAALAAWEVVGGIMEMLFDDPGPTDIPGKTYPDFTDVAKTAGIEGLAITQTESGGSVTLQIKITNVKSPDDNATYNGTFTLVLTLNSTQTQLTIDMSASITASGAPFTSLSITGGRATMPFSETEGPGEPTDIQGTLTVDGKTYNLADFDMGGGSADATRAHYFLMSYYDDGSTIVPQIVFFVDSETSGEILLPGYGRLLAGDTNDSGRSVAVGENGMIFSSDDGATWTPRAEGLTTKPLIAVEWANNRWVAVGTNVILFSNDGSTWSRASIPESPTVDLQAVAYDSPNNMWIAGGGPPTVGLVSTDNGASWFEVLAETGAVPNLPIQELFAIGDGNLVAVTLSGIYQLTFGEPPTWSLTADVPIGTWTASAAQNGPVYAATVWDESNISFLVSSNAWANSDTVQFPGVISGNPVDLIATDQGFAMVTNMGSIALGSPNGRTWTVFVDDTWGSYGILYRP